MFTGSCPQWPALILTWSIWWPAGVAGQSSSSHKVLFKFRCALRFELSTVSLFVIIAVFPTLLTVLDVKEIRPLSYTDAHSPQPPQPCCFRLLYFTLGVNYQIDADTGQILIIWIPFSNDCLSLISSSLGRGGEGWAGQGRGWDGRGMG